MLKFVRWDYHVVIAYDPMRMRVINPIFTYNKPPRSRRNPTVVNIKEIRAVKQKLDSYSRYAIGYYNKLTHFIILH
jgi:hypothetical protein